MSGRLQWGRGGDGDGGGGGVIMHPQRRTRNWTRRRNRRKSCRLCHRRCQSTPQRRAKIKTKAAMIRVGMGRNATGGVHICVQRLLGCASFAPRACVSSSAPCAAAPFSSFTSPSLVRLALFVHLAPLRHHSRASAVAPRAQAVSPTQTKHRRCSPWRGSTSCRGTTYILYCHSCSCAKANPRPILRRDNSHIPINATATTYTYERATTTSSGSGSGSSSG
ncbi:hypothetical protein B0H12DRAFT_442439 [Mycena haematopus]|nr:hypothetical protein B0H12DRAFT_442439 [Mycena haematopus]